MLLTHQHEATHRAQTLQGLIPKNANKGPELSVMVHNMCHQDNNQENQEGKNHVFEEMKEVMVTKSGPIL